ncbi:MAG: hypothetical protein ACK4YQ_10330 [Phenylobacterium sp.]|uniref:hypothetical protein n=1 Tax=Phenylobacterium sp. TaxID=1871053 RepID=UPI003919F46A
MKSDGKDERHGGEAADREAKLAQALRANLRRRKAPKAAKSPAQGDGDQTGDDASER